MACFSLGLPLVGEYWLHSTRSSASLAASRMNLGGLYPKKPCPMLTMGCLGDAAAASLMMDLDHSRLSICRLSLQTWLFYLSNPNSNSYAHSTYTHAQLTTHPASGPRPVPRALASDCHSWRSKFGGYAPQAFFSQQRGRFGFEKSQEKSFEEQKKTLKDARPLFLSPSRQKELTQ